jgi:hypothetical protein
MYLSATPEIRVETSGMDVSYLLPVRPLGKLRWIGLILIAFAILFVSVPAKGIIEDFERLAITKQGGFDIVALVSHLLFFVVGSVPGLMGLLIICGTCRVDWCNQRLSAAECLGIFRWRRRMPRELVRKLKVDFPRESETKKPITDGSFSGFGVLIVEFERSKPRNLVLGYPREWLVALAQELTGRVGASSSSLENPAVEVAEATSPELTDANEKPVESRIQIESRINGISFTVPPAGLQKGSKGTLVFGIIWCSFMALFTVLSLGAKNTPLIVYVFNAVFWLVGLGMVTGAINMSRRHATVAVDKDSLRVYQTTLFGTKNWDWRRGEIAAIRADGSGMAVNGVQIIELQIHPASGKKVGFFAGRSDEELRWLATQLRATLGVSAK